jgi:hypothetical protein
VSRPPIWAEIGKVCDAIERNQPIVFCHPDNEDQVRRDLAVWTRRVERECAADNPYGGAVAEMWIPIPEVAASPWVARGTVVLAKPPPATG